MSAFEGTPGPWEAVPTVAPKGWHIEARDRTYTVAIARDGTGDAQNVANARLIAAAPELLEALVALFNDYKRLADSGDAGFWNLEDVPEGKQALAAIAKATGEQS